MNATISALLWCAIQVTVLTCGVAVVYLAARRFHPRSGAAAASGGLLMVIALTVMAASPWPRWSLSEGSDRVDTASPAVSAKADASVSAAAGASSEQPDTNTKHAPVNNTAHLPSYWSLLVDAMNRTLEFGANVNAVGAKPQAAVKWPRVVVWLFLVGGLVAAARLAWGVAGVRRLARSGRAVDDSRVEFVVREMQRRLELTGTVAVRESDELATPATVGWRRPVVLLPSVWREWSDTELRAVIAHELAHISGRDYAAWFVARLAVVAHFYHPLVRWLASRLQLEQELAADMAAASLLGDPKQYLHSLAALALSMPANRMAGPARTLFPSRSLLVRRVEMLRTMGMNRSRRGAVRYATFAMVALVGLAAAGLRRPGVDLAANAFAAESTENAAANGPIERLGLEVVPADAIYVLSARPARLASRDDVGQLVRMLGERTQPLADAKLGASDVAEVMMISYGKATFAFFVPGPFGGKVEPVTLKTRFVLRFAKPAAQQQFVESFARKYELVKNIAPSNETWESSQRRMAIVDATTVVIDQTDSKTIENIAPINNALPEWAKTWHAGKEQPIAAAVNVAAIRILTGDLNHLQGASNSALMALYPLLTEVNWAVANIVLDDTVRLTGVLQSDDEASAKKVRDTFQAAVVLMQNMAQLQANARVEPDQLATTPSMAFQKYLATEVGKLLDSAKVEVEGSNVNLSLQTSIATAELAKMGAAAMPAVEQARQAARQSASINNLRQLQLAMLNYESTTRTFPTAAGYSKQAGRNDREFKHPHSWRVAILPFLEERQLYDQYHFDEPWDSEANKKVLVQMPALFRSPNDEPNSTNTSYFVFTGPDTVFPDDKATRTAQIRDGASKTFSIVEAKRPVPWTKPEDIEYATDKPVPKVEGWVPGAFLAAFVDGHVENMSTDMDETTLRGFITKAESAGGGEGGIGRQGAEFGKPLDFMHHHQLSDCRRYAVAASLRDAPT